MAILNGFSPTESGVGGYTTARPAVVTAVTSAPEEAGVAGVGATETRLSLVPSGQVLHESSMPSRPFSSARTRATRAGPLGQKTATRTATSASTPAV